MEGLYTYLKMGPFFHFTQEIFMLSWFRKKFRKETPESIPAGEDQQMDLPANAELISPPAEEVADEPSAPIEQKSAPDETAKVEPRLTGEPATSQADDSASTATIGEDIVPPPAATEAETSPAFAKQETPASSKKSLLSRLAERLARTRESFTYQIDTLFLGKKVIDAELLDDLEEILIGADLGINITQEILDRARRKVSRKELANPAALKDALKQEIRACLTDYQSDAALVLPEQGPFVIMVIGVNGVGKTTTIGKIAHKFIRSGQSVMLVAGDTFRAAAVAQLKIWGERNNIHVVAQKDGADPSSVVFDALAHAQAKNYDVVLVDTAGRLHTQANLMEELKKIKRVMAKKMPGAPHETMLVLDATTGQNGISQAKMFNEAVAVTGITLTKLDGTAKGGIVAHICRELKTPIRFIGVGEQMEDLRDFDPEEFVEALFESGHFSKINQ